MGELTGEGMLFGEGAPYRDSDSEAPYGAETMDDRARGFLLECFGIL